MRSEKGAALTAVIVLTLILSLIGAYALTTGQNQARQVNAAAFHRAKIYYRAQGGVVDAMWRIRTNHILPAWPAGSTFTDPTFDPPVYFIDIDTDMPSANLVAGSDVKVDIGPVNNSTGLRSIDSTGLDR